MFPVGPKDVNIRPEGAVFCYICEYLHWFELEGKTFLERMVIYDELWVHHFTPESKWSSMEWHHKGSPLPKKIQDTALSWQRSWEVRFGIQKE
jgi:hypothetical protein